jgi:hypothetical protein
MGWSRPDFGSTRSPFDGPRLYLYIPDVLSISKSGRGPHKNSHVPFVYVAAAPRPHPHARSTHPGRVAPVVLVQTRRHSLTVTKDAVWFMVRFLVIQLIHIDLNLRFNIYVVFTINYFLVEDDP